MAIKCMHCQFYPNSYAAWCHAYQGIRCGNLAFILRHLSGYEGAGPRIVEADRAAYHERPLDYGHNTGQGEYAFGADIG